MGDDLHRLQIETVEEWAVSGADLLARAVDAAIERYERCIVALSGGSTPWPVFVELAARPIEWSRVVLTQADERLVTADHPERNLTEQRSIFEGLGAAWMPLPVDAIVEAVGPDAIATLDSASLAAAAAPALADFTARLVELADEPPVLDVAQLGLGADGHTASLIAGDPAVEELRHYVAITELYGGHRRLTLTRPLFDRARIVIWLARGSSKAEPLGRLLAGDLSIPAGLIRPRQSIIVADTDAARQS